MKSCTEYKAIIDRHPGIDEPQRAELESHLDDCRECSAYKAEAETTSRLFRELRSCLTESAQSDRAYEALSIRLKESGRQKFWALTGVGVCTVAAIAIAVRGDLTAIGALIFLIIGLLCAFFAWWSSRGRSELHPLKQPAHDFYGDWRQFLKRRIRITTLVAGVVTAEIVVGGVLLLLQESVFLTEETPILVGLGLLLGIGVLHTFFQELPQLRKELLLVEECIGA